MTSVVIEAGELMARRNGSVDPAKFPDEQFELHSIPAFDAGQPEILYGRDIGSAKQIVQPADVMISKIVPHIRRASVVGSSSGLRQIASGEWIVFRSERIFPHYLRHLLRSDKFNAKFMATVSGVGGSLLRARPAEVAKIKIPLPAITEQRRIAAILDKADALRAKRRDAIAKLDQLLQSEFIEVFGDPLRNSKKWPRSTLGEECEELRNGLSVQQREGAGGVAISRIETIARGVVDPSRVGYADLATKDVQKHLLRPGDILFSHINSTQHLCKSAIYFEEHGPMVHGMNLLRLRPGQRIEPIFLLYLLKAPAYRASLMKYENRAVNQSSIAAGKIKEHPMPLPDLRLQKQFSAYVEVAWATRAHMVTAAGQADRLFKALQHVSFAG